MDRCRAPAAAAAVKPDHGDAEEDNPDELAVFPAERYFYGDGALLWCARSSSSLSASSAFRTTAGTLEHDRSVAPTPTAATSSSEASWNSRSALLPPPNEPPSPPAEKLRSVAVGGAVATPAAVAEPEPCGAEEINERAGRRRASSSSSSSNLRRWLLGVAGCACAGGDDDGDGEEAVSADDDVPGVDGKRCNEDARRLSPRTDMFAELAFEEAAAAATVRRGSGRWLLEGGKVLVETDAFSPIEIAGHRRVPNSGELSMPLAVWHPPATSTADERRRVKSFEKFRPFGNDDQGISALCPAPQNSSAFTIVAGGNAPRAAASGAEEEEDDDAAAASELGCAYPPSEASVVWSVATADGAASGNFSSAASGYYYHYHYFGGGGEDGASRRHDAAASSDRRRRSGIAATTGSLLACMSDKAVDAVGPVHRPEVELGAAAGGRNDHGGGYHDVMRRRVGR
ncbi:unnamed protein product [Urochloa decumbens]|uniref:Uncharacterized protein n=1 Tax=Urochloa decumbens TaxID=240449 RepID=A0ABC8VT46_9POAL